MGVKPFAIATSVSLIIAQRLARRLCSNCKAADRHPRRGAAQGRLHAKTTSDGHQDLTTPVGCDQLHRRLQGPRRHLPGHADHRRRSAASSWKAATRWTSPTRPRKEGVWDLRRVGPGEGQARHDQSRRSQQRHRSNRRDASASMATAVATTGASRHQARQSRSSGKARTRTASASRGKSLRAGRSRGARRPAPPGHRRQQASRSKRSAFKSGGKVNAEDIAIFTRQLATMLTAGIPLVQSFDIVGNGHDKPAMQKLMLDDQGATSRPAPRCTRRSRKHPLYFDDLFVQPGRGRRAGRYARDAARQDRDLQGKDRGDQEEDQEGAVLPGRGARGRRHRHA